MVSASLLAAEPPVASQAAVKASEFRLVTVAKVATVPQRPVLEVRIRGTVDDVTLRTLRSAIEGAYPSRPVFIEARPDGGVTLLVM